jgi:hypothetical protein
MLTRIRALATAAALSAVLCTFGLAQDSTNQPGKPVIWIDPGSVASRDLKFGPGAPERAPKPPFTFVKEVTSGESPKFDVKDANGVTWRIKLGREAQAETVATRLVWAVGYFAEEAYYLRTAQIRNLPRLKRGREFVQGDTVTGAKFEPRREELKEGQPWDWDENPFAGTRELDGLKILMILLNNYDARKDNNKIYYRAGDTSEALYYVSDLGATLGKAGGLGGKRSKNDFNDFQSTRFVVGLDKDGAVKFDYDTRPTKLGVFSIFYPPYYKRQVGKEKSMRNIPVEHARWIGSLLSQLTEQQLRDAFDAAGYAAGTRDAYVRSLKARIDQLSRLPSDPTAVK